MTCRFLKVFFNAWVQGHSKNLVKTFSRLDIRKFSFSQSVVSEWNSLPEWVPDSSSVHCLKVNIDAACGRLWFLFLGMCLFGLDWFLFLAVWACIYRAFYGAFSPPLPFNLLCYVLHVITAGQCCMPRGRPQSRPRTETSALSLVSVILVLASVSESHVLAWGPNEAWNKTWLVLCDKISKFCLHSSTQWSEGDWCYRASLLLSCTASHLGLL